MLPEGGKKLYKLHQKNEKEEAACEARVLYLCLHG